MCVYAADRMSYKVTNYLNSCSEPIFSPWCDEISRRHQEKVDAFQVPGNLKFVHEEHQ